MFFGYGTTAKLKNNGRKFFAFYLFSFIFMSFFVLNSIPHFIDYDSYESIIKGGWAWDKYYIEPVSAAILMGIGYFSFGAFELYLFVWFVSFFMFFYVFFRKGSSYAALYLYLITNPVSLILMQFSRQYIAYLFFLMSFIFLSEKIKSFLFLFLSILSHAASSAFSVFTYYLTRSRYSIFLLAVGFSVIAFYLISSMFFLDYINQDAEKGRGRVILVVLNFIFFIALSLKRKKVIVSFVVLCSFFIYSFFITPQAGRFAPYFIAFLSLYGFSSFRSKSNVLIINIFFISNLFVSFYILIMGKYGFGP